MTAQLGLDFSGGTPARHARRAAATDTAERLLVAATYFANQVLDELGYMTVARVRGAMFKAGVLANDGKEKLDALGALGRRMGLVAMEQPERLTPEEAKALHLEVSHGNRHTRWRRRHANE